MMRAASLDLRLTLSIWRRPWGTRIGGRQFRSYCAGLILPGDRKSVEPIAARFEPRRAQGAHQSLHHFVANADSSQEDLLRRVRAFVLPAIEKSGRINAWIVEGVDKTLHSRFASLRVRPAHRDYWRSQPYAEEWLLVEWPRGESAPTFLET